MLLFIAEVFATVASCWVVFCALFVREMSACCSYKWNTSQHSICLRPLYR